MAFRTQAATLFFLLCLLGPGIARAQLEGDLNEDGVVDIADVTAASVKIADNPTTPSVKFQLDFNRDGLLDGRDPAFIAETLLGLHGFLPQFRLSDELTGEVFITNQSTLDYEIEVSGADGAFTVMLGTTTLLSGDGSGSGMATFTLVEGTNLFTLVYADAGGNEIVKSVEIRRDTDPPVVQIDTPIENALFQSVSVEVTGQAIDGENPAFVEVNGFAMTSELDGRFHGTVVFNGSGPRTLTAVATDAAGNQSLDSRKIEIYVSAPQTQEIGEVKIDLGVGAICRQGETVALEDVPNSEIMALLGPGTDGLRTVPPPTGLTDGIIVLPNAMMVAVESSEVPESDLEGQAEQPMFASRPVISLENTSGADNSMPIWIFQVIPDSDGDDQPELALVSRAKVAEEGPNIGRIVPIEPEDGDGLFGTFNPDVPVFEDDTIAQVGALPGVQRLMERLRIKQQAGQDATARVTFYCCAASAVVPVRGSIKCDSSNLEAINNRIIELQEDLLNLGANLQNQANMLANAENQRIAAVENIAGFTQIPGTMIKVPTLINGKAFGCLKNFVSGGAEAALESIDFANNILATVGDIDTAITGQTQPPDEILLRLQSLSLDAYDERIKRWAENASTAEWLMYREQFAGDFDAIRKYKDVLSKISLVVDCGSLIKNTFDLINSWTTIVTGDVVAESESQAHDVTLRLFKRYADCKRQLVAASQLAGIEPGEDPWLRAQISTSQLTQDLMDFRNYMEDAMELETDWADYPFDFEDELGDLATATYAEAQVALDALEALVMRDIGIYQRQEEFYRGFDAVVATDMLAPSIVARVQSDATTANADAAGAIAARGGYGGALLTMQNIGSPFTTMSAEGGQFIHYVFTTLSTTGTAPDRFAVLADRPYTATAQALGGILSGTSSGMTGEQLFPFTPFSTVDFDVVVDIGDVFISPFMEDTGGIAPTVQITRPTEGFNVPADFPLRVEVQSSDDVAVAGVELVVNGISQIGIDGGLAQGIVNAGSQLGAVQLQAFAADLAGNIGMDSITINVIDPAGAFEISPNDVRLVQGAVQQFNATYLGAPAAGVTWRVNGFEGGIAETLGTIDTAGLYDTALLDNGGLAAYMVMVSAELEDFPGLEAKARVLIIDSGDVIARPLSFSFPSPSAPGGLLVSPPLAFSFPAPNAPGGLLVSPPLAFSFPSPAAPGGVLPSRPLAFDRD